MKSREKTKEQLKENLRKTREELTIQKWGLEKTLGGMKVLVKEAGEAKAEDEAILASIGDGLVVVDKEGKILMVNSGFENLVGWTRKEVLGKLLVDVVPREDEAGKIVPFNERVLTKILSTTTTTTWYYIRKDKTRFPAASIITPFIVAGKIIGAVEVFRDVSKEKDIDRVKTEFVSIASHGLRTPLTAIDGLVSMMLDGEYGEVGKDLKQPLEDVNTSSERLIHLVNDLLSLSRIQAGRLEYNLSDFSISNLVSETVKFLLPLAQQKKLKIQTGQVDNVSIQADYDKVKEIFDNLIGNSIKFTNKGSITVSTKVVDEKIEVDITDTGIGISKEDQQKLFGMFQQLESSRSQSIGTGLGLHISRELVRKMGGDLRVKKSEVGIGSTFTFSLPIAKKPLAAQVKEEIGKEAEEHPDQKSDTIKLS